MRKQLIALITAVSASFSVIPFSPIVSAGDENGASMRIMENLDRGTAAVKTSGGVYLSWRLLGTEDLANQAFDIYRDGTKIHTTGVHDATCYTDAQGTAGSKYIVVPSGESKDGGKAVTPWTTNVEYNGNSVAYKDILFTAPSGGTTPDGGEYTYSANDMSAGDLDGDGEYEIIVKWDPSNSQDNSKTGYTGEVYMDAYKLDGTRLWRMDLGKNIRAGAHYTQYLVYDFDGDGQSEIIFKTAPGSKDGKDNYVSQAGKTDDIKNADDTADYRSDAGLVLEGPEWLTVFNGETGEAMDTVNYDPPRSINNDKQWGDGYGNRCERYLAGVAYLDGVHPSAIMTRGYYTYAYAAAYSWDGRNLTEQWLSSNAPINGDNGGCTVRYANGTTKRQADKTLYGQGAHSVSVADVDNDGFDELIFGSAVLDHDGTVLVYDGRGHGDAEHVSDFDNDGQQEIFFVHEAGKGNDNTIDFAVDIKRYNGDVMLQAAKGDIGRGVMANIDDEYAVSSGNLAAFWSSANGSSLFNQKGEAIGNIPYSNSNYENFFIYWDGDLGRELLDGNKMAKQSITNNTTTRIFYNRQNSAFPNVSSINGTKSNPGLVADILGDWREEVIYPLWDGTGMRIFFSTIPTDYRLTTLMHDSQYRCAVAWQNVAYNQPPHTSYYIGSAALAKSGSTTLNYLAPATVFDEITYPNAPERTPKPVVTPTPAVTATPKPDNMIETILYERGYQTAWSEADRAEWGASELTDDYGLHQTGGNGSNSAQIKINPDSGSILQIEAYWIGMSDVGRRFDQGNCSYFRFGDIWIMQNDQSQDSAYSLSEFSASNYTLFTGPNAYRNYDVSNKKWYVINMEIDTKTNMLNLLTVRSSDNLNANLLGISNEKLENPDYSNIVIGYIKSGSVSTTNNEYLKAIKVTQLKEAPTPTPTATPTPQPATLPPSASPLPISSVSPSASPSPTPSASPSVSPEPEPSIDDVYIEGYDFENKFATIHSNTDIENVTVIFASYESGKLISVKTVNMNCEKGKTRKPRALDLETGDTVKVLVWKALNAPIPLAKAWSSDSAGTN